MELVLSLMLLLFIAFLAIKGAKEIKIPSVVALIVLGIVVGLPFFRGIFIASNEGVISILGKVGLLSLMFLAGLETSWENLKKEERDSFLIACFAAFVPWIVGFSIAYYVFHLPLATALTIGVMISITAEATKARVLYDLNKLKSRVGTAMIGAGIVDDLIGLILFTIIMVFVAGKFYFGEILIVFGVFAAFFGGILVKKFLGRWHKKVRFTEKTLYYLVVPFFFISLGLKFNFGSIFVNPLYLVFIFCTAFFGKMFGVFLVKPFTNFRWKQLYLIGWGMNSRGAVGLALSLIAFTIGIIPVEIYSSFVITALTTTLTFPFVIEYLVRKNKNIMD